MPVASVLASIASYVGLMVFIEDATTSFGDLISFARSSVIFTSSPSRPLRTRSIPHTGQAPGLSEITVGCIGQVYVSACSACLWSPYDASITANNTNTQTPLFLQLLFIVHNHDIILLSLIQIFHLRH